MTARPELFPALAGGPLGLMTVPWAMISERTDIDAVRMAATRELHPVLLISGVAYARQARSYSRRAAQDLETFFDGEES